MLNYTLQSDDVFLNAVYMKLYIIPCMYVQSLVVGTLTVEDVDILSVVLVLFQVLEKLVIVLLSCVLIGCCHGSIHLSVYHLQLPVPLLKPLLSVPITLFNEYLTMRLTNST